MLTDSLWRLAALERSGELYDMNKEMWGMFF